MYPFSVSFLYFTTKAAVDGESRLHIPLISIYVEQSPICCDSDRRHLRPCLASELDTDAHCQTTVMKLMMNDMSLGLDVAHERENAGRKGAELAETRALANLLGPERAQRLAELLAVLDQDIAVDPQEDGEESLDGLKVAMRLQALGKGVNEGSQMIERNKR